jgi:D-sedoheptulose 7-phosphate isomerase
VTRHADEPVGRYQHIISSILSDRQTKLDAALTELGADPTLSQAAALLVHTLESGHKVLLIGNGGSAAEAQHFAAELVGRFQRDREALAALALSSDPSVVTALANDYGYEQVFARQIEALGRPGDLLIAFSTSGESENLICAALSARERSIPVVSVTGGRSSRLAESSDLAIQVPAVEAALVQELHLLITHLLCSIAESELGGEPDR